MADEGGGHVLILVQELGDPVTQLREVGVGLGPLPGLLQVPV